jgi:hypothetical protein
VGRAQASSSRSTCAETDPSLQPCSLFLMTELPKLELMQVNHHELCHERTNRQAGIVVVVLILFELWSNQGEEDNG